MKPTAAELLRQIVDPGFRPLAAISLPAKPRDLPPLPELVGWMLGPPAPLPLRGGPEVEVETEPAPRPLP